MPLDHPFDRVVAALRAHGESIQARGPGHVRATCPAHAETRPSLVVTRRDDRVLMKCFGCRRGSGDIAKALGLKLADLFSGPRQARTRPEIAATYDYTDRDGALLAQKVRSTAKQFWWRRPDASAPGGWSRTLDGRGLPGLFRWPDLVGASLVLIAEGEKAVDAIRDLEPVATCGAAGASTWCAAWSEALIECVAPDAVIAIVPDNDSAGERHAEHVASDLEQRKGRMSIVLKVVRLPGLPPGGDVFDWLEAGHTREELLAIVAQAPGWSRADREQERREKRLTQQRARMRELRAERRPSPMPDDRDAAVLAAVVARLEAQGPQSWRRLRRYAEDGVGLSWRALERALKRGIDNGVLTLEPSSGRGRTSLYRLAQSAGVTRNGTLSDIRDVTATGAPAEECPSVPGAEDSNPREVSHEDAGVPHSVTLCARDRCERSSFTLQETLPSERHTPVIGTGTLPRPTSVTGSGTPQSERQQAINAGHCCGNDGAELRCKVCRWSTVRVLREELAAQ